MPHSQETEHHDCHVDGQKGYCLSYILQWGLVEGHL